MKSSNFLLIGLITAFRKAPSNALRNNGFLYKAGKNISSICMSMLLPGGFLFADESGKVTLADMKGRVISAIIFDATDQKIMIKKESDGKVFEIDRMTLNQESKDKISVWEKSQLIETHSIILFRDEEFEFKLPKGSYAVTGKGDYIKIKFDNDLAANSIGEIMFIFRSVSRYSFYASPEDIKYHMLQNIEESKKGMTPQQVARMEEPKLQLVNFGDFSGYADLGKSKGGILGYHTKLTNGKYGLETRLSNCKATYMNQEILGNVIKTIKVK